MQTRKLKIIWEDLEEAFNRRQHELASYLDRVTGRVMMEGEGEDEDAEEEDSGYSKGRPTSAKGARKGDATRLYIRPPSTRRKAGWLKAFLDQEQGLDADTVQQLRDALTLPDPTQPIIELLRRNPEVGDAWYAYRADRVRKMIEEWLAADGIEPVDSPPWGR
jgi:hypothetical protein